MEVKFPKWKSSVRNTVSEAELNNLYLLQCTNPSRGIREESNFDTVIWHKHLQDGNYGVKMWAQYALKNIEYLIHLGQIGPLEY
ncbi:hypothetical protein CEXT_179661 [Caerostris extrusa]|uniref:Uncharacterized protein n=1 Tax=Caerostris extrusa TaxID=172846 RepID=A0AAV4QN79_CAEEX|nr:hypothetical protein CEXT_179661 [Caerostris extrusa]